MSATIFSGLKKNSENASKEIMKTVYAVIDDKSFIETDRFISEVTDLGEAVGEGVVSGFAHISEMRVAMFVTNHAVLKGSIGKTNAKKIVRLIHTAIECDLPVIGILDTEGARFSEGIEAMEGYADIYGALCDAYGNVPTVIAVKGANFGLSSYFCAVADLSVAYLNAQIATSSPLLLSADTKEDAAKVCTGAKLSESSDIITNVVKSDAELKATLTDFLSLIQQPYSDGEDDPNRTAKAAELKTPDNIIKAIFDKNSVFMLRANYALEVKTGFARLNGDSVGFVLVDGKLSIEGAGKITELLNTCESFSIPVVNLVNCDGVDTNLSKDGKVIRAVSDMIFTYRNMSAPKVALVYGRAVSVGYTAFVSKCVANYSIAWDKAQIGVTTDENAARLLYKEEIAKAPDKDKAVAKLAKAYGEENTSAPAVSKKGYLDNVIEPALSRPYLIAALEIFTGKE